MAPQESGWIQDAWWESSANQETAMYEIQRMWVSKCSPCNDACILLDNIYINFEKTLVFVQQKVDKIAF